MPLIDPSDPTGRIDTIRMALADPGRFVARPFGDFQFLDWQAMAVEKALAAPALPDPDAERVERLAKAMHDSDDTGNLCHAGFGPGCSRRERYLTAARAALTVVRGERA